MTFRHSQPQHLLLEIAFPLAGQLFKFLKSLHTAACKMHGNAKIYEINFILGDWG